METLKTLELDVQEGKVVVNGIDKSRVSYFKLEFDGAWSLTITENFRTTSEKFRVKSGKKIRPKNTSEINPIKAMEEAFVSCFGELNSTSPNIDEE